MRKERVLILFVLIVVILGVVFFGLYVIAQRNLESTRDQIQAEIAEIEERYQQYVNSKTQPVTESVPNVSLSNDSGNEANMDTITALEQIDEKIRSLESENRKIERMILDTWLYSIDAIYFSETDWESFSDHQKKLVRDFYQDNHDLILEIRQVAATGGPFGILDFSKGKDMEWPHLDRISICRYLLENDAFLAVLSGEYEEAAKDYIAIMQFAEGSSKEPFSKSHYNKNRAMDTVFKGISEHLPEETLSPDTALEIIKQASHIVGREALAQSLKMDVIEVMTTFDEIRSGDYDPVIKPRGLNALIDRFNASFIGRPFLLMDELASEDIMGRLPEIIRLPFYQAKPQLDRINNEIDMLPITSNFSRRCLSWYITITPEKQAEHEARIGLLQIGLAVEMYHGQYDVYPETLDEIAQILDDEVPLDPYTGEDFVYEPSEDSFTLYSARGSVIEEPHSYTSYADSNGNLVWRGPEDWRKSENKEKTEKTCD